MEQEQFHRIGKALADPRRFEMLQRIASQDELGCATLAEEFPVSQPTISHHLKELVNAGLLDVRRDAKFMHYKLRRKVWAEYLAEMKHRIPATAPRT